MLLVIASSFARIPWLSAVAGAKPVSLYDGQSRATLQEEQRKFA
jgi:hypothetical protein